MIISILKFLGVLPYFKMTFGIIPLVTIKLLICKVLEMITF